MPRIFRFGHAGSRFQTIRTTATWQFAARWTQRLSVWLGGIAVALVAIFFAQITKRAFAYCHQAISWHPAIALIIAPAGLALVALITLRFAPSAQSSGIPQTIAVLSLFAEQRKNVLSIPIAFAKIALTAIGLASGASVGREGPTIQVGASLMLQISRIFHMNTALSERSMTLAGITSIALVGNSPYFGHSLVMLNIGRGWFAVGVIGLLGGLLGGLFSRLLVTASQRGLPGAVGRLARRRPVAFATCCGLALACLGLASGNTTYGTGYNEARALLGGETLSHAFFPLKILAPAVSYLSGIPGGLFSPSLSAGAGLGATIANFLPDTPANACILLGMAAYFTGVVQSPITAAVIVMKMTSNQRLGSGPIKVRSRRGGVPR